LVRPDTVSFQHITGASQRAWLTAGLTPRAEQRAGLQQNKRRPLTEAKFTTSEVQLK
jgi:hypothetical protein